MNFLKKIYHFIGLGWSVFSYSRNPNDVGLTFRFADHLVGLGAYFHAQKLIASDQKMQKFIRERKSLRKVELASLLLLPENSLGRIFAQHMIKNNLNPDFYPTLKIKKDEDYIIQRMRSIHDVLHVLTGFDTSQEGELGIQAFIMAQTASPFSMIVIGAVIFFTPFGKKGIPSAP